MAVLLATFPLPSSFLPAGPGFANSQEIRIPDFSDNPDGFTPNSAVVVNESTSSNRTDDSTVSDPGTGNDPGDGNDSRRRTSANRGASSEVGEGAILLLNLQGDGEPPPATAPFDPDPEVPQAKNAAPEKARDHGARQAVVEVPQRKLEIAPTARAERPDTPESRSVVAVRDGGTRWIVRIAAILVFLAYFGSLTVVGHSPAAARRPPRRPRQPGQRPVRAGATPCRRHRRRMPTIRRLRGPPGQHH